jgi:hypothetical protein
MKHPLTRAIALLLTTLLLAAALLINHTLAADDISASFADAKADGRWGFGGCLSIFPERIQKNRLPCAGAS